MRLPPATGTAPGNWGKSTQHSPNVPYARKSATFEWCMHLGVDLCFASAPLRFKRERSRGR
eukprot:2689299-Prymnesium_polylepis.1